MKILAFGLVGAVLAALVWGGIAYLIHMESGWVAWGVGFLVGVAVALGNDGSR